MRRLSFIIILIMVIAANIFAQSPHGKDFGLECSVCHNSGSWKVKTSEITFNHSKTSFPLTGQHKSVDCRRCHSTLEFSKAKNDCSSCHKDIHKNSVSNDCSKCHSPQTWLISNINELHQKSRFPLLGNHKNQDCSQCHQNYSVLNFNVQGIECYDCHKNDYASAKNPDHAAGQFSANCVSCHSVSSIKWSAANVNHSFFPLTGGHSIGNCYSCHKVGTYSGLSKDCYSCHKNSFETTTNPNHKTGNFSTNCTSCHTITDWKPSSFNHSTTGFLLTGRHIEQSCNSCHSAGYTNTPKLCINCHQTNYTQATNPIHSSSDFPATCEDCHTTNSWTPSTFNHDGRFFPINSGKHFGKWNLCTDCHNVTGNFKVFSCATCHEHNQTDMDSKHAGINGYTYQSTACFNCHPQGSKTGAFNHSISRFPLLGSHTTVPCQQCHTSGYSNTSMECFSCHQTPFNSTTNPNHLLIGISTDCKACHNSALWIPSTFSHSATAFPLTGKHTTATCESCHKNKTTGTSSVCYSCHKSNFDASTNPNHLTSNFPTTCEQCHSTSSWTPATFNHSTTRFPLLGSHTTVACQQCHATGYVNTSMVCVTCHQTPYNNSRNPNHVQIGISNDCVKCHNSTAWIPSTFLHTTTKFILTGKHLTASCESCHINKTTGTSSLCYSCHKSNFDASTNPNHLTSNFPTTCEQCHTTSGWSPATFNHALTAFPLTGKHTSAACLSCHQNGYTNTSTACYSCHQTNYTQATNPNHLTSGFPTTCADCHTTNGWTPATFDHDGKYFPIYSGTHKGEWNACADCHNVPSNYKVFACTNCHEHTKTNTDSEHRGVSNYTYLSSACYSCHPQGRS